MCNREVVIGGMEGGEKAYRDLNEPEGCIVSILRKILLLRFRIP